MAITSGADSTDTRVRLGSTGPSVFPIALGCMGMSGMYGAASDEQGIATIRSAIDRGVNLIDTGDFYGMGHNEMLVGRAIADRRDEVCISVKFGTLLGPDGMYTGLDARPQAVKAFAAYSLRRLGTDIIDIYRPARLDPAVPVEDTVGAIAELVKAGYVKHIGLSEVGPETIRRAHAVHPIVDVQIEYSLISRGPEQKIFPLLAELDIGATLYGVLSKGLLTGRGEPTQPRDVRAFFPRFSPENVAHNTSAIGTFAALAKDRGQSSAQLAIAWVLAKQPMFVPLLGARTPDQLNDLLGALERPLSRAEADEVEGAISPDAIAGDRYQPEQMANLDSEI